MSIDKIHGEYCLSCDICGEGPQQPFESFDEAIQYKKNNGWSSLQNRNGEWVELCDNCARIGRSE